jgi:hypothetical protein
MSAFQAINNTGNLLQSWARSGRSRLAEVSENTRPAAPRWAHSFLAAISPLPIASMAMERGRSSHSEASTGATAPYNR